MNLMLVISVASLVGAVILLSIHIDRRRSGRDLRKEEESVVMAYKKWLMENQDPVK